MSGDSLLLEDDISHPPTLVTLDDEPAKEGPTVVPDMQLPPPPKELSSTTEGTSDVSGEGEGGQTSDDTAHPGGPSRAVTCQYVKGGYV